MHVHTRAGRSGGVSGSGNRRHVACALGLGVTLSLLLCGLGGVGSPAWAAEPGPKPTNPMLAPDAPAKPTRAAAASSGRSAESSAMRAAALSAPDPIKMPMPGTGPAWDYRGDSGPQAWSSLGSEYALCGSGVSQSPVDLSRTYNGPDPRIQFNYKPSHLKITNTGHTLQVTYDPGSFIKIDDRTYDLQSFHFHLPSEHTVKGQPYDMELHLVHRSAEGAVVVVAVFLQRGDVNEGLTEMWEHLPTLPGEERTYQTVMVNAATLLPSNPAYYLYNGSLTEPPCTEGVRWSVMATPVQASDAQVLTFKRLFPMNARPVQPLHDRFLINVTGGR
jgi:carbonic anhydrase